MLRALPALLALLLLAGCLNATPSGPLGADPVRSDATIPRLQVVAFTDSGINPYQEAFAASPAFEQRMAATVNASYTTLQLSTNGTLADRMKADAPVLQSLKPGQLYHFAGTRILAISFLNRSNSLSPEKHVILDDVGHGTETSSLVARADPDSLIVMAQVEAQICDDGRCPFDPSVAEALKWIAAQPWTDLISISMGVPGAPPDSPAAHPEMQTFLDASRAASSQGKLVVIAAGNLPNPTLTGYTAGPPWVIAVGGYEMANRGESATASKGVDVIANFTALVAAPNATNGTVWTGGTSFSTPTVAGTFSRALGIVRAEAAKNGTRDLRLHATDPDPRHSAKAYRDAMNASAVMIQATDYDPTATPGNETPLDRALAPAVPIVSPTQEGWGAVYEGLAQEIATRVLSGNLAPSSEKASTAQVQAEWQAAREAYWP